MRKIPAFLIVYFLSGCASEPQQVRTINRWDPAQSLMVQAEPVDAAEGGIFILRRTAARSAHIIYAPDGSIVRSFYTDLPVTKVLIQGSTVYYIEEIAPARGIVWKAEPGSKPVAVSEAANWTDLVIDRSDSAADLMGFESLFLSRDVAPSAVKVYNLTRGGVVFEDLSSYHYPFAGKRLLLVSPIDRKVRVLSHGQGAGPAIGGSSQPSRMAHEIGTLTSLDYPPVVSHDGRFTAWFGPNEMGTSLFMARNDFGDDENPHVSVFITPLSETPMTWLGEDLVLAHQDALTSRWTLRRYAVPTGLIKATLFIPANFVPRRLLGSKSGEFLGIPTSDGSALMRVSDGFIQEFFNIPLSAWRFSEDGKRLFLVEQSRLQVIDLKQ